MSKIKKLIAYIRSAFEDERASKIVLDALSMSKPEIGNW
jgi:hypothetical protein